MTQPAVLPGFWISAWSRILWHPASLPLGQRLVRVLCKHCRVEDPNASQDTKTRIIHDLGLDPATPVKIWASRGCDACSGTGYSGRVAIHEILAVDAEIRNLIMAHATAETIKRKAIERDR